MYLLYLDDSGSVADPHQAYFVLGGIAVFERQVHWLDKEVAQYAKKIAAEVGGRGDDVELHGSPMLNGKDGWHSLCSSRNKRKGYIKDSLEIVRNSHRSVRLFGVSVHKQTVSKAIGSPIEYAFEQVISRFDHFLRRISTKDHQEKGLLILDESTLETRLQSLARGYRTIGHRWGVTKNIVEVPLFVDSKATRLVQLADLIAFSMFRFYERGDVELFDIIKGRFDNDGSTLHGLLHYGPTNGHMTCRCPACLQRRI